MDGKAIMTLVKMIVLFKNVFPEITLLWLSGPLGDVQIKDKIGFSSPNFSGLGDGCIFQAKSWLSSVMNTFGIQLTTCFLDSWGDYTPGGGTSSIDCRASLEDVCRQDA